ncbi:MAG: dTMP kinase [Elusimicrobia bacterium]|nr:dTMP kinase [Elusimicrobiota bacterium]
MSAKKGVFITFEGPDGSGKTTQSGLLVQHLRRQGYDVFHTREPGGTSLAEFLRGVLLRPDANISPVTELLLYSAARAQHTVELIKPALSSGKVVVCERYTDATVAYQGYGRGLELKLIATLNGIATGGLKPDLTIILDIPVRNGLKRVARGRATDRLENEKLSFHEKVRKGYMTISKKDGKRVKIVLSKGSILKIQDRIKWYVESMLKRAQYSI